MDQSTAEGVRIVSIWDWDAGREVPLMPTDDEIDPLTITWLRDSRDRIFHAVPADQLPPVRDPLGPVALCGRLVLLTSLLDDPAGAACRLCLRRMSPR